MTKRLRNSFILYCVFFAVIIAWYSLSQFFKGVGLNYVALITILCINLTLLLTDNHVKARTIDLLIASAVFTTLEFVIYLVFEFRIANINNSTAFLGIQNAFSFIAILMLAYTMLRFILEIKNIKLGFIEVLLGNRVKKVKATKGLENKPAENLNREKDIRRPYSFEQEFSKTENTTEQNSTEDSTETTITEQNSTEEE